MLSINTREIEKLEKDLKTFAKRAYPFATKSTVNGSAFAARSLWQRNIKRDMITKNTFTANSIRVEQARGLNIDRQMATVGSVASYMAIQEFGGTEVSKGKEGVVLPTSFAAGQQGQRPRTRLPRRARALQNIQLGRSKRKAKNRKQALLFKVQDAVRSGRREIFHNFGGSKKKGVFKVVGGTKGFRRGWPKGARLKMLADMSEQSVNIPRLPTLLPAINETQKTIPVRYARALRAQLRRHRLFT